MPKLSKVTFKGIILIHFLLLFAMITFSQNRVLKGETIDLNLNGYKGGQIIWQFSEDKQNWIDTNSENRENLSISINNSGYYRAKVNNCILDYYSDTLFFKIHEKILNIGVFGGSLSSTPESNFAKSIWLDSLGIKFFKIETKGTGGAGFSSITKNSIPNQIRNSIPFDIYVLWASTNDYTTKVSIGDINSLDSTSQNGGINLAINLIRKKNDKALILFFTSLPLFYWTSNLDQYVIAQKNICVKHKIQFLDQFSLSGFTRSNYTLYYNEDAVHLKADGYVHIGPLQASFLKNEIFRFFNL